MQNSVSTNAARAKPNKFWRRREERPAGAAKAWSTRLHIAYSYIGVCAWERRSPGNQDRVSSNNSNDIAEQPHAMHQTFVTFSMMERERETRQRKGRRAAKVYQQAAEVNRENMFTASWPFTKGERSNVDNSIVTSRMYCDLLPYRVIQDFTLPCLHREFQHHIADIPCSSPPHSSWGQQSDTRMTDGGQLNLRGRYLYHRFLVGDLY
jgi:hypothetical protein